MSPYIGKIDVIYAGEGMRPRMVSMWSEATEAHNKLTELHEEWAGM